MSGAGPVDVLRGMYAAYLAGDRASIDTALAPAFTMFDSDSPDLVVGFAELNAVRAERPDDSPVAVSALTIEDANVVMRDDAALVAYWLRVDFVDRAGAPTPPAHSRNSAWMVPAEGGWQIAHLHEELWEPGPGNRR